MGCKPLGRVFLMLYVLVLIIESVYTQNRLDKEDPDALDIPLLSKLDAPLKATLDITDLNKQLISMIDKKVNDGVKRSFENIIEKTIERRLKLVQNELTAWNNNILGTVQNSLAGKTKGVLSIIE